MNKIICCMILVLLAGVLGGVAMAKHTGEPTTPPTDLNSRFTDRQNNSLDHTMYESAMSGDLIFSVSPATVTTAPTSAAWSRTVTVTLVDSNGNTHNWFDKAIATGVSIADTSTAGTASIPSTTLTFTDGVATVVVSGDAADWLNTETDTLTVAQATILGYTVASKTSVETFTTP